jgi:hypothetical protein
VFSIGNRARNPDFFLLYTVLHTTYHYMTPRQVRIEDEQYGALEEIGRLEDRPVSYLIRQAIKLYLEHKAQERRAQSRRRRK